VVRSGVKHRVTVSHSSAAFRRPKERSATTTEMPATDTAAKHHLRKEKNAAATTHGNNIDSQATCMQFAEWGTRVLPPLPRAAPFSTCIKRCIGNFLARQSLRRNVKLYIYWIFYSGTVCFSRWRTRRTDVVKESARQNGIYAEGSASKVQGVHRGD